MTKRKFYRTVIQVEVLSEEPYDPETLGRVHYDMIEGACSGRWSVTKTEKLDGKAAVKALREQGSDPGFFFLDEKGNDLE